MTCLIISRLAYLSNIFGYIKEFNLKIQTPDRTMFIAWNNIESFKKKLKFWLNMIAERNNECFSHTQFIIWIQMIYIHRIQFQILLQLTSRYCSCRLKSIIPNMRIPRGKICGLWFLLLNTNRQHFLIKKPFHLLNYHRTMDWKVLLFLLVIRNSG